MLHLLEVCGYWWDLFDPFISVGAAILGFWFFFRNKVAWDDFRGYQPTVIPVVRHPKEAKILVCQAFLAGRDIGDNYWVLPQTVLEDKEGLGGATSRCLAEEVGINDGYSIIHDSYLWKIAIKGFRNWKYRDNRRPLQSKKIYGKGYTGMWVQLDSRGDAAVPQITLQKNLTESRWVTIGEARALLDADYNTSEKRELYRTLLRRVEKFYQYNH